MKEYELPEGYNSTRSEEFKRVWMDEDNYPAVHLVAPSGVVQTAKKHRDTEFGISEYFLSHWAGYAIPKPLKVKRWKPAMERSYHYIGINAVGFATRWAPWYNSQADNERYANGNVFPSAIDTQKVIDAMETIAQVRERVGV